MSRTEIIKYTRQTDNGKLTEYLENLEYCSFIRKYNCIGMKAKNALYQLMDNSYASDIQAVVAMDDLLK